MENLKDLQTLLNAYYGETATLALMKDGTLKEVTSKLNPEEVEKFTDKKDLEKQILVRAFGTDSIKTEEYELIIKLLKIAHSKAISPVKDKTQKKYNMTVRGNRGDKVKKPKKSETPSETPSEETTE